jgi:hypothetical protein
VDTNNHPSRQAVGPVATIAFIAFGLFLLVASIIAIWGATWPWFLPPQIDLLFLLFLPLGEPLNRYLAGSVLAGFSLLMIASPFILNRQVT